MGQARERPGDRKAALKGYSRAFEISQEPGPAWHFLNNNCMYCLNAEGYYREAQMRCSLSPNPAFVPEKGLHCTPIVRQGNQGQENWILPGAGGVGEEGSQHPFPPAV